MQPRARPLTNTGIRSCLGEREQRVLAAPPVEPAPAMITGRSASRSSARGAFDLARVGAAARATARAAAARDRRVGLAEHVVEREVEEDRPASGA